MSFPYSFHPFFKFLMGILKSILIRSSTQSSPDVVARPVDPTSSADFYGLFDAHGPTHSQAEELKVCRSFHLTDFISLMVGM
jgi:hypothetical protein